MVTPSERQAALAATSVWWFGLVSGITFLVLGFIILSFEDVSLLTVSILIGLSFLFAAFSWLIAAIVSSWWFIIGSVIAFCAAFVAFVYPGETLTVLGLLLGWFLLIAGIFDVFAALANRRRELWWAVLLQGIIMIALGVWAVGEDDRSVFLLLTLTGVYCVIRGIGDILGAFLIRKVRHELEAA
jgi:uncharacterized membrane protein HdeD (DUF308 family)